MFDSSPTAIVITNIADGTVLTCNDMFYQITGYTHEDIIDDKITMNQIFVAEGTPVKSWSEIIKGPQIRNKEIRIIKKSGEIGFGLLSFNTVIIEKEKYILSNFVDLSEQKQTEEFFKLSERKFQTIFGTSPDLISITRLNDGKFITVNESFTKLTGYSKAETKNNSPLGLNLWKNPEVLYNARILIKKQGSINNLEAEFRKKNGDIFTGELSASLIEVDDEDCVLFILRDVTLTRKMDQILYNKNAELTRANELLTIAKQKAEESNQLKTAFLNNISHEIRTPMNAIMGFSSILEKNNISEEKKSKLISIIQKSSNQLLNIVNDILTISSLETKQEKLIIEKTNLNELMDELYNHFKKEAFEKKILLVSKYNTSIILPEIFTDRKKISQILTNLISNALKFTHQGKVEYGYEIYKSGENKSKIEFYVSDTGIGLKSELHEMIFERFFQAEQGLSRRYRGTGLGLTITKCLLELFNGEYRIESEPEKGFTFKFSIPVQSDDNISQESIN